MRKKLSEVTVMLASRGFVHDDMFIRWGGAPYPQGVGYYFSPRIFAAAITVPMVVLLAELIGIVGGLLVSNLTIGLHPARYINSVWLWLSTRDIYISLFKAFIFGILISLVCATQGYETNGGAKDVGVSTTRAAVLSTIYMLVADFIINIIFYL